jgi:uncharacterized protein (UPF0335 family)
MEDQDTRLRLLIERIEGLESDKADITDDIKDVYNEGASVGYDKKAMREVVRLRKMERDARREFEAITEVYKNALGID